MKCAEYFARGGFGVLAYDNINFGESGGEPRQEVDPALRSRRLLKCDPDLRSSSIWSIGVAVRRRASHNVSNSDAKESKNFLELSRSRRMPLSVGTR